MKSRTAPTASVCVSQFKDRDSEKRMCLAGGGGRAARAAKAVTMSTNLCERWLRCSQKMHVRDYNVPIVVSDAFLEFQRKRRF